MTISRDWFDDSDRYTGLPLTQDMIQKAEREFGYKLPHSYIDLLSLKNGGIPKLNCYPTKVPTSWAEDHIEIYCIYGIGGRYGIDSERGSRYLIREWGYPDIGVVIGHTPSAGPEPIMLDYSICGPTGEPRVIYVDVEVNESNIIELAQNFAEFIQGVVSCDEFEDD